MPARHAHLSSTWIRSIGVVVALFMWAPPSQAGPPSGEAGVDSTQGQDKKCRQKRCAKARRRLRRRGKAVTATRRPKRSSRLRRSSRTRRRRRALRRFNRLAAGPGYHVLRPRRAWGTKKTVDTLKSVLTGFHKRFPDGPTVYVHDLSARWGGRIWPHKSHRLGRDVDIRVICKNRRGRRCRFSPKHNWHLVQELIATGEVQYIFTDYHTQRRLYLHARRLGLSRAALRELFQYPRRRRVRQGLIRHEPRHHNHFHVRFRRPDSPRKLLVLASL